MTMSPFIKQMIQSRQLDFEEGEFRLLGIRGVILPAKTFTTLIEDIYEGDEDRLFEILFHAGKEQGRMAVESVARENGVSKREFFSQLVQSVNVMGVGEITIESFDIEKGRIIVSVERSIFAEEMKDSDTFDNLDRPVDSLIRGMIHSIGKELFDSDVVSREFDCAYQGNGNICRIEVETQ